MEGATNITQGPARIYHTAVSESSIGSDIAFKAEAALSVPLVTLLKLKNRSLIAWMILVGLAWLLMIVTETKPSPVIKVAVALTG